MRLTPSGGQPSIFVEFSGQKWSSVACSGAMRPPRIDDKGRLKVPQAFRLLLEPKYGRELFVTSISGEYLRMYPMPVWLEIEQKLAAAPSTDPSKLRFLERTNYFGADRRARHAGPRAHSRPPSRCRHHVGRRRRARTVQLSRRLESRSARQQDAAAIPSPTTMRAASRSSAFDRARSRAHRRDAASFCSRNAAVCSSTAPSASAATRARCSKPARRASSDSIATSRPSPRRGPR